MALSYKLFGRRLQLDLDDDADWERRPVLNATGAAEGAAWIVRTDTKVGGIGMSGMSCHRPLYQPGGPPSPPSSIPTLATPAYIGPLHATPQGDGGVSCDGVAAGEEAVGVYTAVYTCEGGAVHALASAAAAGGGAAGAGWPRTAPPPAAQQW